MSNLLHHIVASVWSFALVAGVLSLIAKVYLSRRLDRVKHPTEFDTPGVYIALAVPGLVPAAWLVSALMHLEETGALMEACCSVLLVSGALWHQWFFAAGALIVLGVQAVSLWKRWQPKHDSHAKSSSASKTRRVRKICENHPQLAELADRVRVVDCELHVCATVGLFDQRIEIAAGLVDRLDDAALEAALLHEAGHLSLRDPARGFVLMLSQILNPFSRLLSREASAWRFAREIACDGHAVDSGARPVSLADAIVTAAKANAASPKSACAQLCGDDADGLSARVNLLLNGSTPEHVCDNPLQTPVLGSALLAAALVLPHLINARLISFHCLLEESLATLTYLF